MNTLFLLICTQTLKAAVMVPVVWLVCRVGRKWIEPRWRHLLWILVFLRLVVPDLTASKWSVYRWEKRAQEVFQPVVDMQPAVFVPTPPRVEIVEPKKTVSPTADAPQASIPRHQVDWLTVGGWVWLAGVGFTLFAMAWVSLLYRRRVTADVRDAPESWVNLAREVFGHQKCTVKVSAGTDTPLVMGLSKPIVVIPPSAERMVETQRRHLLLHEAAHWSRRDVWTQIAVAVLLAVHWFNPLLWVAWYRLRMEAEAAADAVVLRKLTQVRDYGQTLLQVASQGALLAALLLAPGLMFMSADGKALRERLVELARSRKRHRAWALIAIVLAGGLGLTMFTRAEPEKSLGAISEMQFIAFEGTVVGADNQPLEGAKVEIEASGVSKGAKSPRPTATTDKEGRFVFKDVLKSAFVWYRATYPGFAGFVENTVADGMKKKAQLRPAYTLNGSVRMEGPGGGIAKARILRSEKRGGKHYWFKCATSDADGLFKIPYIEVDEESWLRVDAPGYESALLGPLKLSALPELVVNLRPGSTLSGMVVDSAGTPVPNALVWLAEGSACLREPITAEWITRRWNGDAAREPAIWTKARSQADGSFDFMPPAQGLREASKVIAVTEAGVAAIPWAEFMKQPVLQLQPWATVRVKVHDQNNALLPRANISLSTGLWQSTGVGQNLKGQSNENGLLEFTRVLPSGQIELYSGNKSVGEATPAKPGQTIDLDAEVVRKAPSNIPRRSVMGRLVIPEPLKEKLRSVMVRLKEGENTEEPGRWEISPSSDGTFIMHGVPVGKHMLSASLPGSNYWRPDASAAVEFWLPAEGAPSPFDLGKLELIQSSEPSELPLPKGPEGRARLRFTTEEGLPLAGVRLWGPLLYASYAVVYRSDPNAPFMDMLSDADGRMEVVYPRDAPGRDPIAAVSGMAMKEGYYRDYITVLDGINETRVLKKLTPFFTPDLPPEVRKLKLTMGGTVHDVFRQGDRFVGTCVVPNTVVLTDVSSESSWRFCPTQTLQVSNGRASLPTCEFSPGVEINGTVHGLSATEAVNAYAHVKAECQEDLNPGETRAASHNGTFTRSNAQVAWTAWVRIKTDGTFRVPGVPMGRLSVGVIGENWWGQCRTAADPRFDTVKMLTPSDMPLMKLEFDRRSFVARRIKVQTPEGTPAEGAFLRWYRSSEACNNSIHRHNLHPRAVTKAEDQAAYEEWRESKVPGHEATTGADGIATLKNISIGQCDVWVTWKDPATLELHRREVRIGTTGPDDEPWLVDLAKGKRGQ